MDGGEGRETNGDWIVNSWLMGDMTKKGKMEQQERHWGLSDRIKCLKSLKHHLYSIVITGIMMMSHSLKFLDFLQMLKKYSSRYFSNNNSSTFPFRPPPHHQRSLVVTPHRRPQQQH
jgi:hypothetical protein